MSSPENGKHQSLAQRMVNILLSCVNNGMRAKVVCSDSLKKHLVFSIKCVIQFYPGV